MADEYAWQTRGDFLGTIREKYPEYTNTPDDELYTGLISKYPEYAPQIKENFDTPTGQDLAAKELKTGTPIPEGWVGRAPKADLTTIPGGGDYLKTVNSNLKSRRGFIEGLTDVSEEDIPFLGDVFVANQIRKALSTYKKLDKNEDVTDEELVGFNKWLAESRRMENATWQGKAGDVIRGSAKFWMEIGAASFTGGSLLGAKVGTKVAKETAEKLGKEFLEKETKRLINIGARKEIEGTIAKTALNFGQKAAYNRAVGAGVALSMRTAGSKAIYDKLSSGVAKDIVKSKVGKEAITIAAHALEAGAEIGVKGLMLTAANPGMIDSKIAEQQLRQYVNNGTEDQARAVVLGVMDAFNENASEMSGWTAGKLAGRILPKKLVDAAMKSQIFRIVNGKVGTPGMKAWFARAGVNGVLEEMYEERVAGFAAGMLGLQGDDRAGLGKAIELMLPDLEQMKTELLAFSIPGMAMASHGYLKGTEAFGGAGWANFEKTISDITLRIDAETDAEKKVKLISERDAAVKRLAQQVIEQKKEPGAIDRMLKAKFGIERTRAGSVDDLLTKMNYSTTQMVADQVKAKGGSSEMMQAAIEDHLKKVVGANALFVGNEGDRLAVQPYVGSKLIEPRGTSWLVENQILDDMPELSDAQYGNRIIRVTDIAQGVKRLEADTPESGRVVLDVKSPLIPDSISHAVELDSGLFSLTPEGTQDYLKAVQKFQKAAGITNYRDAESLYTFLQAAMTNEKGQTDPVVIRLMPAMLIRDTAKNARKPVKEGGLGYHVDDSISDETIIDMALRAFNHQDSEGRRIITLTQGTRAVDAHEDYLEVGLKRSGLFRDPELQSIMGEISVQTQDAAKADPNNKQLQELAGWWKDPAHRFEALVKTYLTGRLGVAPKERNDRQAFSSMPLTPAQTAVLDHIFSAAIGANMLNKINQAQEEIKVSQSTVRPVDQTEPPKVLKEFGDPISSFSLTLEERIKEIQAKPLTMAGAMTEPNQPELRKWHNTNHSQVRVVFGEEGNAMIYDKELGLRITFKGGAEKIHDAYLAGLNVKLQDLEADKNSREAGYIAMVNTSVLQTILQYEHANEIPEHLIRDLLKTGLRPDVLGEWFESEIKPHGEKDPRITTDMAQWMREHNIIPGDTAQSPDALQSRFNQFQAVISQHFEGQTTMADFGKMLNPFYRPGEWIGWQIPDGMTGRAGGKIDRLDYTRGKDSVTLFLDSSPYNDGHEAMPQRPDFVDELLPRTPETEAKAAAGNIRQSDLITPLNPAQKARLAGQGEQGAGDLNVLVDGIDVIWNKEKGVYEYSRPDGQVEQYEPTVQRKIDGKIKTMGGTFRNKDRRNPEEQRQVRVPPDVGLESTVFRIDAGNIATNGELLDELDMNDVPEESVNEDAAPDMGDAEVDGDAPAKVQKEIRLNEKIMNTTELETGHEIDRKEYDPAAKLKDQGILIHVVGESAASGLAADLARQVPEVTPVRQVEKSKYNTEKRKREFIAVNENANNPIKFQRKTASPIEANAPQFAQLATMLHNRRHSVGIVIPMGKDGVIQDTAVASRYRRNIKQKDGTWKKRDDELVPNGQPAAQGFYSRLLEYTVNGMFPMAYQGETMDQLAPHLNVDFNTPYKSRLPILVIHEGMSIPEMSAALYSFMHGSGARDIVVANFDRQKTDTKATPGQWLFAEFGPALVQALNAERGTDRVIEDAAYENGIEYRHVAGLPYVEMSNGNLDQLQEQDRLDVLRRTHEGVSGTDKVVNANLEVPNLRGKPGLWDPVGSSFSAELIAPDRASPADQADPVWSAVRRSLLLEPSTGLRTPEQRNANMNDINLLKPLYRDPQYADASSANAYYRSIRNELSSDQLRSNTAAYLKQKQWYVTDELNLGTASMEMQQAQSDMQERRRAADDFRKTILASGIEGADQLADLADGPGLDATERAELTPELQNLYDTLEAAKAKQPDIEPESSEEVSVPADSASSLSMGSLDDLVATMGPLRLYGEGAMQTVMLQQIREYRVFRHNARVRAQDWMRETGAMRPRGMNTFSKFDVSFGNLVLRAMGARIDNPNATHIPLRPGKTTGERLPDGRSLYSVETEDSPINEILAEFDSNRPEGSRLSADIMEEMRASTEALRQKANEMVSAYGETEWIGYVENYLMHRYRGNNLPKNAPMLARRYAESTGREEARKLPTYADGIRLGLTPLSLNAAELHSMWAEDVGRVMLNKMMMNSYGGMTDIDGSPIMLVVPTTEDVNKPVLVPETYRQMIANTSAWLGEKIPSGTVAMQLKTLGDKLRTSGEYESLDSPFQSISQIYIRKGQPSRYVKMFIGQPFKNRPVQIMEHLNAWMKWLAIGMPLVSMFHPFALAESLIAASGMSKNPLIEGMADLFQLKRPRAITELTALLDSVRKNPVLVDDAIRAGLGIDISHPDVMVGLVDQDIKFAIEGLRANKKFFGNETIADGLERLLEFKHRWDGWLWNTYQPVLKLFTYQGIISQRMEQMAERGEYMPENMLREETAAYVNKAYGGLEWERFWFATPKMRQLMHLTTFAPDWTFSSFQVAGMGNLPILRQILGVESSAFEKREMIEKYWPAMGLFVLAGIPNALQFAVWTMTRPMGGDPDDKPFTFMNEPGKETYIDMTPIYRMIGYGMGDSGKRRVYLRWGKQAWEIEGWFTHPYKTMIGKSSQLVKQAIEQVTGTNGSGYKLPYADQGLMGALSVDGSFWDSRVGHIARHFVPFVALNVIDGYPVGYFANASRGGSRYALTQEAMNILDAYADKDTFSLINEMGKTNLLKERVGDVLGAAEANGYDATEIYTRAVAMTRSKYYSDFFDALNSGDHKKTEQAAEAVVRLNGNLQGLEVSMANRFHGIGKEWDPTIITDEVREKFVQ